MSHACISRARFLLRCTDLVIREKIKLHRAHWDCLKCTCDDYITSPGRTQIQLDFPFLISICSFCVGDFYVCFVVDQFWFVHPGLFFGGGEGFQFLVVEQQWLCSGFLLSDTH